MLSFRSFGVSFLLGATTGALIVSPAVRRKVLREAVLLKQKLEKLAAESREDYEDLAAEIRAEQEAANGGNGSAS